jgi:hypothetical protein
MRKEFIQNVHWEGLGWETSLRRAEQVMAKERYRYLLGMLPLQMTSWFTVMLLIVGSGDGRGKSRRYKTGPLAPAASFSHAFLSTR